MKKNKLKKRLIVGGGTVLVLLVVGYFGWNIAVNYFIGTMVSSGLENSEKNANQIGVIKGSSPPIESTKSSDIIQKTHPPDQDNTVVNDRQQAPVQQEPASDTSKGLGGDDKNSENTPNPKDQNTLLQNSKQESIEKAPTQPTKQQQAQPKYDGNISPEKAKKAEDSITVKEKAELTSILLKKLSPSDISLFMKMASDGMTIDEKREAKKVILQKLTEDEYNELIKIAAKYGLSSGRDYKTTQEDYKEPVTNSSN